MLPSKTFVRRLLSSHRHTPSPLILRSSSAIASKGTQDAHKKRLKLWRDSLINRTSNREHSDLQSLLHEFSFNNVPFMLEGELSEFDTVLRLEDEDLNRLISRPGSQEERHNLLQNNFTLDRFLNFARFKSGDAGEYR